MKKSALIVGLLAYGCVGPASLHAAPNFGHTYNVNSFAAPEDVDDTAKIQRAIDAAGEAGQGIVYLPAGTYTISSSLQMGRLVSAGDWGMQLDGFSNIWMRGDGIGQTILRCTAALDASDHVTQNNLINANNLYFHRNLEDYRDSLWVSDMSIDASLQNNEHGPQAPAPNLFGFSLAAIEFQNVNNGRAFNLEVIGAYGNGIVMASIDPSKAMAVANGRIENVTFKNCIRGILKNYGISGSVIQYGAMTGGLISSCTFVNSGGPAIDVFNTNGTVIENNVFTGVGTTPIGAGQTRNSIHSDFGLVNCVIRNNVMQGAGPIFLNGIMAPVFFNANVPTPGPQGCRIEGNTLLSTVSPPGMGAIRLEAGNTNNTHATVSGNIIEGNIIVEPPANAFQLVDARANVFRANEILHFNAPVFSALDAWQSVAVTAYNTLQRNITIKFPSLGADSLTVQWTTDEPATSQVEYGLTLSYGQSTILDSALVTTHTQNLTGLLGDAYYHYRVRSVGSQGNNIFSHDYLFRIPATVPPTITSPTSATGAVGKFFRYTITATNNPTSFNTTALLPPGLSLNATTGVISGTPTVVGVYNNQWMLATNSAGTGSQGLTLTILLSPPVITSATSATGAVGKFFRYTITATNNPTSFNTTALLPPGLSLNATTGVISGTPTVVGVYNNQWMLASNSAGTGTNGLTLTILAFSPPAPVLNLPAFFPINGRITVTYDAAGFGIPSFYLWSFEAVNAPSGTAARTASHVRNGSSKTLQPDLDLPTLGIELGTYRVTVRAYFSETFSSQSAEAIVTLVAADLAALRVFPNPWRKDKHEGHPITIDGLTDSTEIKIFTLSGQWVKTLPLANDRVEWDLENDGGDKVASGLYFYLATSSRGNKAKGQFAIVK